MLQPLRKGDALRMDHALDFLYQGFTTFMFCIAITVLLVEYSSYITALQTSEELLKEDIMFEQAHTVDQGIITRGEIITCFLDTLEYDLEINGQLISKSENVKNNISSYSIPDKQYQKSYAYDNNGNITRIIFTSN